MAIKYILALCILISFGFTGQAQKHFLFGNKAGIAFSLEASKYLSPRFYMVTSIRFNMVPYDFPDVMH